MLPTGHKLTHVGALEVSHSHVMEVEHSSVGGVEDLSGPGLGNDLVEHDLQLAPLPFPVLAALVVQHLEARNHFYCTVMWGLGIAKDGPWRAGR